MALVKFKNRAGQWVELVIDNLTTESAVQALSAKQGKVLQTNKADKATTLAGYGIINAYTKTEIDALISAIFKYKGVKATVADVEAVVDPRIGDVWFVTADSSEYAWNGTKWEKLGPVIDLSHFITQISIAGLTIDAQSTTITKDQLLTALGVYTKEEVDAMKEEVDEHLENIDSIISTDTETVTGDPVTIETKSAQIVEKTVIHIEPVQDLHGYENPWPAGGVNIIPMTLSSIKALNTSGTWNGNAYTLNNVTFTVDADDGGNVKGIKVNGTNNGAQFTFTLANTSISSGNYKLSGITSGSYTTLWLNMYNITGSANIGDNLNGTNELAIASDITYRLRISVAASASISNAMVYPMLNVSGTIVSGYVQPSNICPISGWTGANVNVAGFNVWDEEWENGYYSNSNGTFYSDSRFLASKNKIKVIPGSDYYFKCPANIEVFGYDVNGNYLRRICSTVQNGTQTIPSDVYFITFNNVAKNTITTYNNDICINISDSSKNGTYEAYTGNNTYHITFPQSAGTVYGGTLTVNKDGTGTLVVDRACVELSLDWEWRADTSYSNSAFYGFSSNIPIPKNNNWTSLTNIVCDRYVADKASDIDRGVKDATISEVTHQNGTRIWICDKRFTSVSDFKASLTGAKCVYEIATPITYTLTPGQVKTLLGINNVWADTGNIELTFRKGAFATLEDVHYITESSEDASIYHLGFCIKDGKLCQIYYKEEE